MSNNRSPTEGTNSGCSDGQVKHSHLLIAALVAGSWPASMYAASEYYGQVIFGSIPVPEPRSQRRRVTYA